MLNPRTALPRALVVLAVIALSISPWASAQNGGNFIAGINFAAGAPVYSSNTGYYDGGLSPTQVETADFNNDGKLDIVVAGSCNGNLPGCPASGSVVAVYLSNGNGTFQAPILNGAELPPYLRSIAVGDFNHDGYSDVAAAADCLSTQNCSSGTVTILLGNGKGDLTQSSQYPINGTVQQANTLIAGDFNDDGNSDLAVGVACYDIAVNGCSVGSLTIFLSDGTGKLESPTHYLTGSNGGSLIPVVADFNDDDKLDVAAVSYYSPSGTSTCNLTYLQGNGNGTFAAPANSQLPFSGAQGIVVDDFNSDGNRDLAIRTSYSTRVLFGNGNGTFQTPSTYSGGLGFGISSSDVNGDGKPDLIIEGTSTGYGTSTAILLVNDGTGAFNIGATYPLGSWGNIGFVVGDFNRDGRQDIVAASQCSETSVLGDHCPDGTITVLLGNGNGTLQSAVPANLTIIQNHAVLADMNNDGVQDLVGVAGCCVTVALGIGNGRFGPSMQFDTSISNLRGLVVADLNGDGHGDVIVDGYGTSSSVLAVLMGAGDGSLASAMTYPLSEYSYGAPAIGDFAGNKKLGVAVAQESQNGGASGVGILLGNGDGTLQAEKFTETAEIYPYQVVVGDFNKDGKADLAAFGVLTVSGFQQVGAVTVFLGKGDGTLTVKPDPDNNPSLNPFYMCNSQNLCAFLESYPSGGSGSGHEGWDGTNPLALADLDGDGNLDLIIANECRLLDSGCSTGELVYLHGRGDGTFNDAENTNPVYELPDANYLGVSVADVNSDGKPDIVASTLSGVAVYLAPFTKPATVYATSGITDAEIPAIADINGDGAPDIAIANGSGIVDLLFNRFPRDKSTTTTLTSSANPSLVGQSVTFSAKVTAASGGTPTGNVDFTHNGVFFTTSPLVNGVATFTTSTLSASTGHNVTATYAGSATDATSVSKTIVQQVYNATATTLASSLNPSKAGQSVTLTAKVTASSGGIPAGTVTFKNGTATLATVALSHGAATLTTTALPAGTLSLTAAYAPNSPNTTLDAASTSAALKQVVKP